MLHYVVVCCSVLQCFAVCCSTAASTTCFSHNHIEIHTSTQVHFSHRNPHMHPCVYIHRCEAAVLQCGAVFCSVLQRVAVRCSVLFNLIFHVFVYVCRCEAAGEPIRTEAIALEVSDEDALGALGPPYHKHVHPLNADWPQVIPATHCNTMQHIATHCNTLQHTAFPWHTRQRIATHCNVLRHTATHCSILQCTGMRLSIL